MNIKLRLSLIFLLLTSCIKESDNRQNEIFIIKKIIFDPLGRHVQKYGLMNKVGEKVVETNYRKIDHVGEDYFIGEKDSRVQQYYKINDESLLFDREFEVAKPFSTNGLARVKSNNKWGFINKKGEFIVPPLYDLVGEFSEGFAPMIVENKVGFIDEEGKIIIEPKFDLPTNLEYQFPEFQIELYRFVNGLCPVNLGDSYGYINNEGIVVIDMIYSKATPFKWGYAVVEINEDGKQICGIIDRKGEWTIKPQFDNIFLAEEYFIGSFPSVSNPNSPFDFVNSADNGFSYFNYDGSKMIDKVFYGSNLWTYAFSENKAFVCKGIEGPCGYIDKEGRYVIDTKYFEPPNSVIFKNGISVVATNNNQNSFIPEAGERGTDEIYRPVCIINDAGKILIPPVFIDAQIYSDDIIKVIPKEHLVRQYLLDHVFYIDFKGNYVWNGYEEK